MKYVLAALGIICVGLGTAGIFVPMLPTTPFLLLAAALFARSSRRLYRRLLSHRVLGVYIRSFLEERAIPLRVKVVSLTLMWGSMAYAILGAAAGWVWLQAALGAVAVGVTLHILSYKTKK